MIYCPLAVKERDTVVIIYSPYHYLPNSIMSSTVTVNIPFTLLYPVLIINNNVDEDKNIRIYYYPFTITKIKKRLFVCLWFDLAKTSELINNAIFHKNALDACKLHIVVYIYLYPFDFI